MKRVAFLYDHVLDVGGVENYLLAMANRIDRKRYEFVILSRCSEVYRQRANAMGIQVVNIRPIRAVDPLAVGYLIGLMRTWKVDLLHIHGAIAATPGRLAAHLIGVPVVVTFHLPAVLYHGSSPALRARVGRWISTKVDQACNFWLNDPLIYVSETIRQVEIRAGRAPESRARVIYNGINLERFGKAGLRSASVPDGEARKLVVTFVGRLDTQKGVDVLLEAIAQLPGGLPEVEFWLVGSGPKEEELLALARKLDVKNVSFLGNRSDIPELLAASDIFVLPSRFEGMPVSLLEAMAAELACVVTDVGENRRVIADGVSGIVVEPDNARALMQGIVKLVQDQDLRSRLALQAKEESWHYSEIETAAEVQAVYDGLLPS